MKAKTPTVKDQKTPTIKAYIVGPEYESTDEIRKTENKERIARGLQFVKQSWGSDEVYTPWDSLTRLRDDEAHNTVLQSCNRLKAILIARLGHTLQPSPYNKKETADEEKAKFEEWIKSAFKPSLSTVLYRKCCDYFTFAKGCLLIDENRLETENGFEIHRIRHLNRMTANPLKPRKIKRKVPGKVIEGVSVSMKEIEVDDPADVAYPRWVIGIGDSKRYAKTYGDKRYVHKYAGHAALESWGVQKGELMDGAAVFDLTEYDPRDERLGWPLWDSSKTDIDISWDIGKYELQHFQGNCMPNLIAFVPEVKVKGGGTLGDKFKTWLQETSTQRAEGGDHRKVLTIEMPKNAMRDTGGKLQFHVQEIKGPDPSEFLALSKRKDHKVAMSCQVPPGLIHAETGSLGSGREKDSEQNWLKQTVITPMQETIEREMLDVMISQGTNFTQWVIRLNRVDTSDKKQEAEIAKIWGEVPQLKLGEKREKVGVKEAIDPDDEERSKKLGQILLVGLQPMSLDQLEAMVDRDLTVESEEADEPEEKKEPESDAERFTRYREEVLGMDAKQFKEYVLPAIKERVASAGY